MKLVSVLAVTILSCFFFSSLLLAAEPAGLIEITSITHSKQSAEQEKIRFALNGSVTAKMFALQGERPRLVIDFPGTTYKGKNIMELSNGELADTIRIGLHKEPTSKTRVVVDLSKTSAVDYKHSFIESENLLEVVLTRGEQPETAAAIAVEKDKTVVAAPDVSSPGEKEPASDAGGEKKVSPAVTPENMAETVAEADEVSPGVPQLLEVSFDGSSNRGEMVLFHLNDFFPPTVSAIEKNNPRVLCDFPNMRLSGDVQKTINAGGKYVEAIRTAYHATKDEVRVVLDLFPDRNYDLQQVFFKNDNLFVLIVNELPSEKKAE